MRSGRWLLGLLGLLGSCDRHKPSPTPALPLAPASSAPASAAASEGAPAALAAPGDSSAAPAAPPRATGPRRVLVLGDSQLMSGLGERLESLLRERYGEQIWMYATCGGSPRTWSQGAPVTCSIFTKEPKTRFHFESDSKVSPPLARLLKKIKPEVTVLALGANMIRSPAVATPWMRPAAEELRRSGSTCVWLGPPPIRLYTRAQAERINDLVRQEVADLCPLVPSIDSIDFPSRTVDNIHYDRATGIRWANAIFEPLAASIDAGLAAAPAAAASVAPSTAPFAGQPERAP